ncbi:MAG: STAS domain-containing protein [Phycisphaerae bacterium]|nr:STAS domain-containing protein [Phycisphaerae bacterium]
MEQSSPKISVAYAESVMVIGFTEERILEQKDIDVLSESLTAAVEKADNQKIILDFGNVKFLSSAVLGVLIRITKKIYERGGKVRFCSIDPKIFEIFKITRLNKIFEIYPDMDSAQKSFSK